MLTFEALVRLSQHVAGTRCAVNGTSVAKPFHFAEAWRRTDQVGCLVNVPVFFVFDQQDIAGYGMPAGLADVIHSIHSGAIHFLLKLRSGQVEFASLVWWRRRGSLRQSGCGCSSA